MMEEIEPQRTRRGTEESKASVVLRVLRVLRGSKLLHSSVFLCALCGSKLLLSSVVHGCSGPPPSPRLARPPLSRVERFEPRGHPLRRPLDGRGGGPVAALVP